MGSVRRDGSIFVSVPSFRDSLCSDTVNSAFESSSRPDLVFVGVCEQNLEESERCAPFGTRGDHVRVISMPHVEAKGPCYARYLCSTLYRGEQYYMQVDSHTLFVRGWDDKLREMARMVPERFVLSHYPQPYDPESGKPRAARQHTVPVNCGVKFREDMPVFKSLEKKPGTEPRPMPGIGGGMLFMPGEALLETPLDPNLDFLFTGEEILYGARLYTRGWDVYAPHENVVYHFYARKDAPKFWDDEEIKRRSRGIKPKEKVARVLGLDGAPPLIGRYGLGWKRSISSYFTSLDGRHC
jgi:hypothetical protein